MTYVRSATTPDFSKVPDQVWLGLADMYRTKKRHTPYRAPETVLKIAGAAVFRWTRRVDSEQAKIDSTLRQCMKMRWDAAVDVVALWLGWAELRN